MYLITFVAIGSITVARASIDIGNVNNIRQQLPPELANTNITLDDVKEFMKEKCISVAGNIEGKQAFSAIEPAALNLMECITNVVNFTVLQAEIEELKPQGDLDLVFNKYCRKRPEALNCVKNFNEKLLPCLDKDEQETNKIAMRIITSLLDFACYKDGDRIALFIAESGPECFESKKDDIAQCLNTTLSLYSPKKNSDDIKTNFIPKLVFNSKLCLQMEELAECVVTALEKCEEITPSNIVESIFRYVKNETICRAKKQW